MRESRETRAWHCVNIHVGGWCGSYPEGARRICPILKPYRDEYRKETIDYCPFKGDYGYHVKKEGNT